MTADLPVAAGGLRLARDAEALGMHSRFVTARDSRQLIPVRRGAYLPREELAKMSAVARYRANALAAAAQRRQPIFAGFTAAVFWGLPLLDAIPNDIFLLAQSASGRRRNAVVEFSRRDAVEIVEHNGLMMTSLPDTLVDVARTLPFAAALCMVDAALRTPRFGAAVALCTRAELLSAFERRLPFSGSRRVRVVLERCSHLADSPLETLSRVQLEDLGFPEPVLQLRVQLPRAGRIVWLDFAWPEYGVWGEADGDGKYLGNAVSGGDTRPAAHIVVEEKKRENAVRAATRWNCGRWDWREARESALLRAILREAGLPVTRRPWRTQ
ncbi:hypothetical protein [Microterricola pindariensis]|uniref:AbiEi antitoxin C-terminal domain-containing protein n=1 Tax=Microterricola pindariensis TaxID=478010 RepID=A0ABX5AX65_9MICO|nr:hypothetical protein [Microterricola pindariensis]PPL19124.1 hypothetical protein GY24_07680 [Microterricola pindariensis]